MHGFAWAILLLVPHVGDGTTGRLLQTAEQAQKRTFPATICATDDQYLAWLKVQGNSLQDNPRTIAGTYLLDTQGHNVLAHGVAWLSVS
jgi:hypothetical protein